MNDNKKILIILVLYNCKIEDSFAIKSLLSTKKNKQLNLFVYDNSPISNFENSEFRINNLLIKYQRDLNNSGVSKAYNVGAKFALENGYKWILLLDQDTRLPKDAIDTYSNAINKNVARIVLPFLDNKNDIISPSNYFFKRGSKFTHRLKPGLHRIKNKVWLNSGTCINTNFFWTCNGYDNRVELYYSDFIFRDRVYKLEKYFYLIDLDLYHDMSSNDMSNNEEFKKRFLLYLRGARQASFNFNNYIMLFLTTLVRTLKLYLKTYDSYYFRLWFNNMLLKIPDLD